MSNDQNIKLLSLISGGIDSPVATYLMVERGAQVSALYFDNRPFTDEKTKNKVIQLVDQLRKITSNEIKLYIIPHGNNQKMFARNCNRHVGCILCRRMMLRLAERLADKINAHGLITGESLGQVASQTLQNLNVENQVVKIPIIRPLIGLDKLEIEAIAQKIGTYDISILPGLCCTIVPKKPSTNADLNRILSQEKNVDIDILVEQSLEKLEII
jgi:thiamine biosynthesis protein ThiI